MSAMGERAIELLELAIGHIRDGEDALGLISAAATVLRVEAGELPIDELAAVESIYEFSTPNTGPQAGYSPATTHRGDY